MSQGDLRLHSQVDLFIILTRIYFAFGPDVDLEVPETEFPKIDQFDIDLGDWKSAWLPRLGKHSWCTLCLPGIFANLLFSWESTCWCISIQSCLYALPFFSAAVEFGRFARLPLFDLFKSHVTGAQEARQYCY